MINYRREGKLPKKPHSVFRDDNQSLLFEHCFTRDGFDGPFSILYNEAPPQGFGDGEAVEPIFTLPVEIEGGEKSSPSTASPFARPRGRGTPLLDASLLRSIATLLSAHVVLHPRMISTFRMGTEMSCFISSGKTLISPFGRLDFGPGDYVFVPQALAHRISFVVRNTTFSTSVSMVFTAQAVPESGWAAENGCSLYARDFRGPELVSPIDTKSILSHKQAP